MAARRPEGAWVPFGFALLGLVLPLGCVQNPKITAGDLVQTSEVRSGGSYLSQSDLRVDFGLGDKQRVDKVEIFWPEGATETLTSLVADHFYCVKERKGVVQPAEVNPGVVNR
ncbi:MAG TPA: ASPIC/UnbV domain-containing protein [Candidatus Acidoferrum sp.]